MYLVIFSFSMFVLVLKSTVKLLEYLHLLLCKEILQSPGMEYNQGLFI